jgi:HSP20 family protein
MNLVRFYQPRYSVNKNLVNEMMNSFLTNDYHENYLQNCRKPAINIFESENDFKIEMMLPGFTREDLKINFHNEMLTIKVDNKETEGRNNEEYKFVRREFEVYNFEKQFKVPQSVKAEAIDAKFENGILNIVLPKKEEALEKAPVDIKVL